MAVIKLKIEVAELENVLTQFNCLKVYRSITGVDGTFTELTTITTRIPLLQNTTLYEYDDTAGEPTYWYKISYYHTVTALESDLSAARLGDYPVDDLIMSLSDLKTLYLFGLDLTNDAGEPFPDLIFEWAIRAAISWVEHRLDIKIRPTTLVERYDYYRTDYQPGPRWTCGRRR